MATGTCLPFRANRWTASCITPLITNGWICCDVVEVPAAGGAPGAKRKQKDYNKAYKLALERQRLKELLEREVEEAEVVRPTIRLKKSGLHKERVLEIANIEDSLDQSLAIEFAVNDLVRKYQDDLAIEMLLRNDINFIMPSRELTEDEALAILLMTL